MLKILRKLNPDEETQSLLNNRKDPIKNSATPSAPIDKKELQEDIDSIVQSTSEFLKSFKEPKLNQNQDSDSRAELQSSKRSSL